MKELATPPAIVAPAESATELPGLRKFCETLKEDAIFARDTGAEARFKRLELSRRLCAYGEQPAVKAELKALNDREKHRPGYKGGREFSGKTIAAKALAAVAKIPERTLYRWLAEWTEFSAALAIAPTSTKTLDEIKVDCHCGSQPLSDWFDSVESSAPEAKTNPFAPVTDVKALKDIIYRKIEGMFKATGDGVLQPRNRQIWADSVESWWGAHGVEMEISFAPRKEKSRR